jgi:hypothetical protein
VSNPAESSKEGYGSRRDILAYDDDDVLIYINLMLIRSQGIVEVKMLCRGNLITFLEDGKYVSCIYIYLVFITLGIELYIHIQP